MAARQFTIEESTETLLEALQTVEAEISWSEAAEKTYDLIKTAYGLYNNLDSPPEYALNLVNKIKDMERLLTLDLERHIVLRIGRDPYYFIRMDKPLQRVIDTVLSLEGESFPARDFDHLGAEFQAAFVEYGLCTAMETIHNEREAMIKLDGLAVKLDKVEKALGSDNDGSIALVQLHDVIADMNGIIQSMMEENIGRLKKRFADFSQRIEKLENNFTSANIRYNSTLFLQYLAGQHLLRRPMVDRFVHSENIDIINGHLIHSGTRGWFLERFNRCLHNQEHRLFYLAGKQGAGKTALSSAVCKLTPCTVAAHFFDSSRGKNCPTNTLTGMIQALAYGMCHTLPEYLNYLDDKLGGGDLKSKLTVGWRELFNLLLKEPIQALYGIGKSATTQESRKLILIDALDECCQQDWADLKLFLSLLVKETPPAFCVFVTARNKYSSSLYPQCHPDAIEGLRLEDRAWINRHIKDIEIYLSSSLGAILSGEDEGDTPRHAKADIMTLQNSIDELLKCSSGRFDYAVELMETFAREMGFTGQFLGSLKKAMAPIKQLHGTALVEEKMGQFASPYRAYRDKEGRSVDVRVIRQSQFLKDKTRVALIRGRHRIQELQNGQ